MPLSERADFLDIDHIYAAFLVRPENKDIFHWLIFKGPTWDELKKQDVRLCLNSISANVADDGFTGVRRGTRDRLALKATKLLSAWLLTGGAVSDIARYLNS